MGRGAARLGDLVCFASRCIGSGCARPVESRNGCAVTRVRAFCATGTGKCRFSERSPICRFPGCAIGQYPASGGWCVHRAGRNARCTARCGGRCPVCAVGRYATSGAWCGQRAGRNARCNARSGGCDPVGAAGYCTGSGCCAGYLAPWSARARTRPGCRIRACSGFALGAAGRSRTGSDPGAERLSRWRGPSGATGGRGCDGLCRVGFAAA